MLVKIFLKITSFVLYLTLFFIIFRITGITDWNWWFVLMPLLIYLGVILLFGLMSILMLASEADDAVEGLENDK